MERFSKGTRGAVSVFLVLILIPSILFCSVFVDLSRVFLSKSLAESSADLALNTLLTNYDADLKNWYGLAASCQTIEEFYEVSYQTFEKMMLSQGLSSDDIYSVIDKAVEFNENYVAQNGSLGNLLQMEVLGKENGISVVDTGEPGANLTNPTLIKDQMVEFMKYRAPIELTVDLIERLSKDESVAATETLAQDEKIVKAKNEHYEAEGEFLMAAYNSYIAIMDYVEMIRKDEMSSDALRAAVQELQGYRTSYQMINDALVYHLFSTDDLRKAGQYKHVTVSVPSYGARDVRSGKRTVEEEGEEGEEPKKYTISYITGSKVNRLLNDLENAIESFNAKKAEIEQAGAAILDITYGETDDLANPVQWWAQMYDKVGGNKTKALQTAANNLAEAFACVDAIDDCDEIKGEPKSGWVSTKSNLELQASQLIHTYLSAKITVTAEDTYLRIVDKLESVSKSHINDIQPGKNMVTVNGMEVSVTEAVARISANLEGWTTRLDKYIKQLNLIIDGSPPLSGGDVPSLPKLKELAEGYDTTLKSWTEVTDEATQDSAIKTQSETEISGKQSTIVASEVSKERVDELEKRLQNIRSQFEDLKKQIESLKYGGDKLQKITDYDALYKAAKGTISKNNIPLNNGELKAYAKTAFEKLFRPDTPAAIALGNLTSEDHEPRIDPRTNQVKVPELVKYLHKTLQSKADDEHKEEVGKHGKDSKNTKKESKEKADTQKNLSRYNGSTEGITPEFSAGTREFSLLVDGFGSIADTLATLTSDGFFQAGEEIRDSFYATSYIMNMFSYSTFENEGKYRLLDDGDKLNLTLDNYDKEYYPKLDEQWKSEKLSDTYNKTLTNKMLNMDNNRAYKAEVEYILFGNSVNKDNVQKVYTDIYTIRYAVNTVSGFANFWSGSTPTAQAIYRVALGIATTTQFIIPAPVTKCVLILLLTAAETGKDMDRLEAGFPVELYKKNADDWWMAIPIMSKGAGVGDVFARIGADKKTNKDKGFFYSDYLTMFVYMGIHGKNGAAMYQRVAEVIQANIRKMSNDTTYSMKNARVYFQFDSTVRVKPLLLTLPIFDEYGDELETNTDWCTYKVKLVRGYS